MLINKIKDQSIKIFQMTQPVWPAIFLILVSFLTFSPSLKFTFVSWDDPLSLDYLLIRSIEWEGIKNIFSTVLNTTYTPLTILSYAVEYHFFKYKFFVYHLDNVLLHCAVVCLSYILAIRLGLNRWTAFAAVLIFAVHPMKVESIAWITERKDMLYAVLYLGAIHAYLSFIHNRHKLFYPLSIFLGLLSMLAKPMALSLPIILLLLDWYFKRLPIKKCLIEKIPYFLYILPLAYITHSQNHSAVGIHENTLNALLICIWSFSFYLTKFFVPVTLVPIYAVPEPISLSNPIYLLSLTIFCSTLWIVYRLYHNRWFMFCFMFYFASIFFLMRFDKMVNLGVVADRFIYLPSLGLCLYLATQIEKQYSKSTRLKRMLLILGLIVLIITLVHKTIQQQNVWKTSTNLWGHVVKHEPTIAIAYNNRGFSYIEAKQWDLAFNDFKKAIEILPTYAYAYSNIGSLYFLKEQYDLAVQYFNTTLSYDPEHAKSHNILGLIYEKKGNLDLALKKFSEAIELEPNDYDFRFNRYRIYKNQGKFKLAVDDLNWLIQIYPDKFEYYLERGDLFINTNQLDLALSDYQHTLQLNPKSDQAYHNLGILFAIQGKVDLAIEYLTKAIQLNPQSALSYVNRAKILQKMGNIRQALDDAQKAQSLGESDLDSFMNELQRSLPVR